MSSDIYKNQQRMHVSGAKPKRRRRRSSNNTAFDETGERRRRSRNSGFRRLLHVLRKPEHEKKFWWGFLIAAVVILAIIGIWQFWYLEHAAREKAKQNEMIIPLTRQSDTDSPSE